MNRIPCEVVRDLLPSYVDQLTSDITNQYMEEHLAQCLPCRELYQTMKTPEPEVFRDLEDPGPARENADDRKIDFLKKNRRRNKGILFGCIAFVVILLGVLFVTRYLIGRDMIDTHGDFFMWDLQVDENHLDLDGRVVNDIFKITGFETEIRDGVLYIDAKVVPSGLVASMLYGREFHFAYDAKEPIHQVNVNGRILYNEGDMISMQASSIYLSRHLYIGDMPMNSYTANMLNLSNYLGPYENELQTEKEPYGWTIRLKEEIPADKKAVREEDMDAFSYVMLAVIRNLDSVTFEYMADGKTFSRTTTSEDASQFLGQDIKDCYDNVSLLDELIRKSDLNTYAFGSVSAIDQHLIYFNVVNNADEPIQAILTDVYIDGELAESQGSINADESPLKKGELLTFFLDSKHTLDKLEDHSELKLKFSVQTPEGKTYEIPGQMRIPLSSGLIHDIHINGNSEVGFTVSQ